MTGQVGKTSSRRFSKWLVAFNVALAWGAIYLAIIYLQAAYVAASGFAFVLGVAGAYMGVGHLDLRAYVKSFTAANNAGGAYYPVEPVTKPSTPEDQLT
ncbi:hypothetical protein QA644_08145 [Rhizobium sp. CC1099]|uniref:hypothetical protein n=1 Tax=Rhizobium sp. CC1099 TaxID=3039160 RepID=UPI0024B178AA|nr:hypothetical protein [Rhizobium sp. CC1099]WFU89000.1 hypothetical protein QA644_08145 [Rhizobium sp. CC1099]